MENETRAKPGRPRIDQGVLTSAQRSARYRIKLRSTGRNLDITDINPQIDEATGKPFIQVITGTPFAVYRLDLDRAEAIAREMLESIDVCRRATQPVQAVDSVGYTTITDNGDILIQRRIEPAEPSK